jgi:hypothetical protein
MGFPAAVGFGVKNKDNRRGAKVAEGAQRISFEKSSQRFLCGLCGFAVKN